MRPKPLVAAAAAIALAAAVAGATMMKKLTLVEIEGYATEIFFGTVQSIETVPDDGPQKLIYTEVTFHRLSSRKGSFPGATVTYRFAGGTYDGRTLTVVGMPRFAVGQRCYLFTNAELDRLCPAVGWWQGRYLVVPDGKNGERIHDSDGRPVYGFSNGRPILDPPKEDALPLSLTDFDTLVKETIRSGEERRRKERAATEEGKR